MFIVYVHYMNGIEDSVPQNNVSIVGRTKDLD